MTIISILPLRDARTRLRCGAAALLGIAWCALAACAPHQGPVAHATTNSGLVAVSERAGIPPGIVHQAGTRLVDGAGAPLTLHAVNLGGWLEWEGWMWGGGLSTTTQTELLERLTRLVGSEAAADFRARVHAGFIDAQDLADASALGFNAVRVPFNCRLLEDPDHPYVYLDAGWAVLDGLLDAAERDGLYVILDLSAAPGGQSRMFMADPDPLTLWLSPAKQARTVALWRAIASRYAARAVVAGYDLLNEPAPPRGADLVVLYRRIIAAIREVDGAHTVVLEGDAFATDFSSFPAALDANQVYSFHMYTWFADHRRDQLAGYRQVSRAHGVPMWCGEFGENSYAMIGSTVDLLSDPANGIDAGWSFWSWKKTTRDTRYPALIAFTGSPAWNELIDWLVSPGAHLAPSPQRARQGMREFLDGVALPRTTTDRDMVDALFAPRSTAAGG